MGKLNDLIARIEADLTELKTVAAAEETPEGEAEEHGGDPSSYAAIMQQGAKEPEAETGEESIEEPGAAEEKPMPFKKKKPGEGFRAALGL